MLKRIESDSQWKCFVCDPKPLALHVHRNHNLQVPTLTFEFSFLVMLTLLIIIGASDSSTLLPDQFFFSVFRSMSKNLKLRMLQNLAQGAPKGLVEDSSIEQPRQYLWASRLLAVGRGLFLTLKPKGHLQGQSCLLIYPLVKHKQVLHGWSKLLPHLLVLLWIVWTRLAQFAYRASIHKLGLHREFILWRPKLHLQCLHCNPESHCCDPLWTLTNLLYLPTE